jgi:mono/diheme cytochrome c family protein
VRRLGGIVIPIVAVLLAIGLGIALGLRSARTSDETALPPATTSETTESTGAPPTAQRTPKELFADTCGSCHTLADAGATAGIGPNLDEARPTRARVLTTIRNGSLSGAMPANLLVGADAERVAAYVSRVAGR